ncbi:MAG: hypothetical protein ABFD50_01460 [Smithella sp.]
MRRGLTSSPTDIIYKLPELACGLALGLFKMPVLSCQKACPELAVP